MAAAIQLAQLLIQAGVALTPIIESLLQLRSAGSGVDISDDEMAALDKLIADLQAKVDA